MVPSEISNGRARNEERTNDQKIIRAKVVLLELAKKLGNVSQGGNLMGKPPQSRPHDLP